MCNCFLTQAVIECAQKRKYIAQEGRQIAMKTFQFTEQTLSVIEELGGHMPGGFFVYRATPPEELLYANKPVFDIFGCGSLEEFKALTGYTFRGMVHPED